MKYTLEISKSLKTELEKISEQEKFTKESDFLMKALMIGLDKWKKDKALERFSRGEETLLKAAEIAGMNVWDFIVMLEKEDITWIKTKPEEIREEIREALA